MHAHAGGAELVVGDYLHDFCGVQLGYPTSVVEGEVFVFESFDGAGSAMEYGTLRVCPGRILARTAGRIGRRFTIDGIHSHVQGGEVDVKEGRVVSVLTFHSAHELGDELERGWAMKLSGSIS